MTYVNELLLFALIFSASCLVFEDDVVVPPIMEMSALVSRVHGIREQIPTSVSY